MSDPRSLSNWTADERGFFIKRPGRQHPTLRIDRTGPEAWLLRSYGHGQPSITRLWRATSPEACAEWTGVLVAHENETRSFKRRLTKLEPLAIRSAAIPGAIIHASPLLDALLVTVQLEEGGTHIGRSVMRQTCLRARYVIGEPTISGSAHLEPGFTGRGLGREICDFQEKLLGLPRVPQGRNANDGDLSPEAITFWEKRAVHRRVPGMSVDRDMAARLGATTRNIDLDDNDRFYAFNLKFAALTSIAMGWPLRATIDDRGHVWDAWCVTEDDLVFTAGGLMSNEDAEYRLTKGRGYLEVVEVTADQIGVELDEDDVLHFGGRLAQEVEWHLGRPVPEIELAPSMGMST